MSRKALLATWLFLSGASWALAYRVEYYVTYEGERKRGSEICFYRGGYAENALSLFFQYSDRPRCFPADKVIDMPPGLFHFFARHTDGYVSRQRDFTVYRGEAKPEVGYSEVGIELQKAALLNFESVISGMEENSTVGAWLARTTDFPGTFFPLVNGETTLMVPAQLPLIPILVQNGKPIRLGDPLRLKPNEAVLFSGWRSSHDTSDVVTWTRVESSLAKRVESATIEPPALRIISENANGPPVTPVFPFIQPLFSTNDLQFFMNVPLGRAKLIAAGPKWESVESIFTPLRDGPTVLSEPVLLRPAAELEVNWSFGDARSVDTDSDECVAKVTEKPVLTAVLEQCSRQDAIASERSCRKTHSLTASLVGRGSLRFESVPAGSYDLALFVDDFESARTSVDLQPGEDGLETVSLNRFSFFGKVTRAGTPVQARLRFSTGESVSDAAGVYTAELAADPLTNLVKILSCDGAFSYIHVVTEPIRMNAPFDIDIPANEMEVNVIDMENSPVADASVGFSPVKKREAGGVAVYYGSPRTKTDDQGKVVLQNMPSKFPLRICATHNERGQKCIDVAAIEEKVGKPERVEIQLQPFTFQGAVVGHQGDAIVTWVDSSGSITEEAAVKTDGTFTYRKRHTRHEHLVYASSVRPLFVLEVPEPQQEKLVITSPTAPRRSFTVGLTSNESGGNAICYVGLWVGNFFVPLRAFAFHQDMRGSDIALSLGKVLPIQDIIENAPISIAVATDPRKTRPQNAFVDPFTLLENIGLPRYVVVGSEVTVPSP